jgi:hypothetical protein
VDAARSGGDKTVFAIRDGLVVCEVRFGSSTDTMVATGQVAGILARDPERTAVVDVIGIGAGIVDRLREQKMKVIAFNASEGTDAKDRSGELGFTNCRSAAWWHLRELLDPAYGAALALPDDDKLTGDLTAPRWKVLSGGRIQIESKDDIRKRLDRSTDHGDAVVQSVWTGQDGGAMAWISYLGSRTDAAAATKPEPAVPTADARQSARQASFHAGSYN